MDYIYYGRDDNQKIVFIQNHDLSPYNDKTKEFFKNAYQNMLGFAKKNKYIIVDISNWKHKDDDELCTKLENYTRAKKRKK